MKQLRPIVPLAIVMLLTLFAWLFVSSVRAGTVTANIIGSSNGQCLNGGNFSPSTVSAVAGDLVAITVTINDSGYQEGWEIRGFPEGSVLIPNGTSHTFNFTASSNFTFSGWWPNSQCHKADGTVSVTQPAPAPSSTPSASSPTPVPAPASSPPAAQPPTKSASTPAPRQHQPSPTPSPAAPSSTQTTPASNQPKPQAATSNKPTAKILAKPKPNTIIIALGAVATLGGIVWFFATHSNIIRFINKKK